MPPVTPMRIRATRTLWRFFVRERISAARIPAVDGAHLEGDRPRGRKPSVVLSAKRIYDADVSYANVSLPRAISSIAIVR